MYSFNKINDICLNVYSNDELPLNEYNINTKKNIDKINNMLKSDFFEVPSYLRETVWGNEIIFLPFTDKLFKIVSTTNNDTSIQLHPRKSEVWYTLSDSIVFDGNKLINVSKNNRITILKNSIHCMKINSCVFEVQDNSIFDNNETVRIMDPNNRKIENKYEYLNYILPHNFCELKIEPKNNDISNKSDIFLFVIDGDNKLGKYELTSKKLYYIKKDLIKELSIAGSIVVIPATYINISNNEID